MIRKQIYIAPHQEVLLKKMAQVSGITEAEIVRQALDAHLTDGLNIPRNLQAWEEEKRFIQNRIRIKTGVRERRSWKREDLYE